jgi:uncharacterized protein
MANFTPYSAFAGGLLIGIAALVLMLGYGRIAGISGIVGGLIEVRRGDIAWRLAFVAGLLVAPAAMLLVGRPLAPRIDAGMVLLLVAGLLVGLGTRYGSGCTSGHGVCGLSRLSPRSLVATAIFMAAGIATVFVTRHLLI